MNDRYRRTGPSVTRRDCCHTEKTHRHCGEHLRALPPDDERYPTIYNRRRMAESLNSWIKSKLPGRRARAYGHDNQHIDLIFIALARNTQARHRK